MSSNTNTLFWVITGAVVVLSSFLLINNTSNGTIKNINDSFEGYAENIINPDKNVLSKYYSHEADYESLQLESEDLFIFDKETQTISGYKGKSEVIVFPYEIDGVEVKKIGNLGLDTNYNSAKNCNNIVNLYNKNPSNTIYKRRYDELVANGIYADGVCQERTLPTRIILPNTIVEIDRYFINMLQTIKEIVIPNSVEIIASNAITNSSLEKLDLSKNTNLKSIGWCAFCGNKISGTVVIPESVTFMDSMTFKKNNIEHVIFKGNVDSIPYNSFTENSNLKDIKIYRNDLNIPTSGVFDDSVINNLIVYIPKGSLNYYKNNTGNTFNLREFDE